MAKYERVISGDFDAILDLVDKTIMNGSISASFEDGSYYEYEAYRCAVRVYERYSVMGCSRVSMSVTLVGSDGKYFLSAITSGGSQAAFFKINTFGEKSFLETLSQAMDKI